ncbi:DUF4190 domain-containing protein [Streptomyces lanatus]|uniref:DUF4190 domain-containing protein n=1 Tax=Streptomyces lanatus TaxID=66900 RepID=A0ABV1XJZ3_9ACTN|nr:DUF4190 domain-containing protein [Streptomyces lanatus]GHG95844.1 membrane protein [Streptomyces lanatus]
MSIPPPAGPQQPYGAPGPYPYGHPGYGPYGRPVSINGLAIASLVLGILCFVPAVGLVLGLIALAQIKRKGERGKGMAVAGSILSTVGLVLWTLALTTGSAADFWDGFKGAATGEGTAFALDKGNCFDSPTGNLEGEAYDIDEVPCSGPHDGEVFAVVTLPGGAYPGDEEVTRNADDKCYALQDGYAMDTWAVPDDVDVYYFIPSRQSWRLGDREITCFFGGTERDTELTGSLRSDPTTLGLDQTVFLSASNAVDTALYEEPEEYAEDDLAANKAWAKDVQVVLGAQIEAMRGHGWGPEAKQPVAELIEEMEDARAEWARAAGAKDADAYYEHYDNGYDYVDGPTTVTAREALGLDTTAPTYEDESEGGGGSDDTGGIDV